MTGGPISANAVKQHLKQMQGQMNDLESTLLDTDESMKVSAHTRETVELEVSSMMRRMQLLESELEESYTSLATVTARLDEANKVAEESERGWREVHNRFKSNDRIVETMEKAAAAAVFAAQEADRKYKEVERNLTLTETTLLEAESRVNSSDDRVKELESCLKELTSALKAEEIRQEEAMEHEKALEERIAMLKRHVDEAEARALTAEQEAAKREHDVRRTGDRITSEHKTYEILRQEMDTMMNEFHSI